MKQQNVHETTIHARCPFAPVWDYYTLTVETPRLIKCEDIQAACDEVRGMEASQEAIFEALKGKIPGPARITLSGYHAPNGKLTVSEVTG